MRSSFARFAPVRSRFTVASGLIGGLAWLGLAAGCGTPAPAKAGTKCFSTIECAAGLVCVAAGGPSSTRVCSSNISSLEKMEDAGMDAQGGGAGTPPAGIYPTDGSADVAPVEDAPSASSAG